MHPCWSPPTHSFSNSEDNSWGLGLWTSIYVLLPESYGNLMSACYMCNCPLLNLWTCHAGSQEGDLLLSTPDQHQQTQFPMAPSAAVWHEGWRLSKAEFLLPVSPSPEGCWLCPFSSSHVLAFLRWSLSCLLALTAVVSLIQFSSQTGVCGTWKIRGLFVGMHKF